MRLNTRMLLEALEKTEEVVVLGPERPELNLHFPASMTAGRTGSRRAGCIWQTGTGFPGWRPRCFG